MKNKNDEGVIYIYIYICDIPVEHVVYVGQTTQTLSSRLSHHAAKQLHPTKLNTYIQELGKQHFKICEIERVAGRKDRAEREAYWIKQFGTSSDCCNIREGFALTEAEKDKARSTNYRNRPVVCHNDGQVFMSCAAAARFYKLSSSDVSECCAMRLKQTCGLYFRYQDVEQSEYIAYWNKGIRRRSRVLVVETGMVFPSVKEASIAIGVHGSTIRRACYSNRCIHGVHMMFVQ